MRILFYREDTIRTFPQSLHERRQGWMAHTRTKHRYSPGDDLGYLIWINEVGMTIGGKRPMEDLQHG